MGRKICTKCRIEKSISEFHKDKYRKDGFCYICKECISENFKKHYYSDLPRLRKQKRLHMKKYLKTFPWMATLLAIRQRCNDFNAINYKDYGGRGIKCLISKEELKELWFRDKAFEMKKPSINRRDNDDDYTFENCQYIEFGKNSTEMNIRTKSKPILQYDLNNFFIKEWSSIREASRQTKIQQNGISRCCNKKQKQSGNFIWKFKNE